MYFEVGRAQLVDVRWRDPCIGPRPIKSLPLRIENPDNTTFFKDGDIGAQRKGGTRLRLCKALRWALDYRTKSADRRVLPCLSQLHPKECFEEPFHVEEQA